MDIGPTHFLWPVLFTGFLSVFYPYKGCHRISSGITVMANNFRAAGTTTTTCIEISAVALRPKLGFLAEELFYLSVRLYCGWLASCWLAMHETTFWKI
ncbi:hypothetical protein ACFX1R_018389 [Malus domestica]